MSRQGHTLNGCGLSTTLRAAPGRSGIDLRVNVITPFMPITSDGKAPNLSCCSHIIREVAGKAVRRALRAEPSEPKDKLSQKAVVLAHLEAAIAKASGGGAYRFSPRQVFYVIRPLVREAVGAELQWGNFETVIGDHEVEQGEIAGMDRDPRGTLYHPHLKDSIPLEPEEALAMSLEVEDVARASAASRSHPMWLTAGRSGCGTTGSS